MTQKDLNTLFQTWWNALDDKHFTASPLEQAREAFFAGYEIGLNRGHAMGQELGTAIARLEAKMKDD